jgi:hypothetical protein
MLFFILEKNKEKAEEMPILWAFLSINSPAFH